MHFLSYYKFFNLFIGSNSSVLEGRILNHHPNNGIFELSLAVTIMTFWPCFRIMGLGVLFDPGNVITTRTIAREVKKLKNRYFVFLSKPDPIKPYGIDKVLFEEKEDTVVSMEFGILKVSYKI